MPQQHQYQQQQQQYKPKPRSRNIQQLKHSSSSRSYTSFKEMGLASPALLEEFGEESNADSGSSNKEEQGAGEEEEKRAFPNGGGGGGRTAEQALRAAVEGGRKKDRKGPGEGEANRQRSNSMRFVEWLTRTRSASSPP